MAVLRRVFSGVKEHFHLRSTEWAMFIVSYLVAMALNYQSDAFSISPNYSELDKWATESTWALILFVCSFARFIALFVNGTFMGFPYSPHLRTIACLISLLFWGLFASGVASSAMFGNGAWPSAAAYSGFVILELVNLYRSWGDVIKGR